MAAAATIGEGQERSTSNWVSVQAQARKHRDSYRLLIGKCRIPPAQYQLGRQQQIGCTSNCTLPVRAFDATPEGQRHGQQQQQKCPEAEAGHEIKRKGLHRKCPDEINSAGGTQRLAWRSNKDPAPRDSNTGSHAASSAGRTPFTPRELKLKLRA